MKGEGGRGLGGLSAASHKTLTLRSPFFASLMIVSAIISSVRSGRGAGRTAARKFQMRWPLDSVVSGSPSKYGRKYGRIGIARSLAPFGIA